ncbi:MAG: T9SS type A sorting domain-containing protein [Gemmatimonadota bacterium]|nr:MAG: T9SS type A sorting domain-containing protein [Gemmatimonadota bacterium]
MIPATRNLFVIICLLLLFCSITQAEWYELNTHSEGNAPLITVQRSDNVGTILEVEIPGFEIREETAQGEMYQTIRMPDCTLTGVEGRPGLPFIAKLVAVPDDGDVGLRILGYEYDIVSNIKLKTGIVESEVRSRDGFWPEEIAAVGAAGAMRDFRVAPVMIYPMRYHNERDELLVYKRIVIELTYSAPVTEAAAETSRRLSEAFRGIYENVILNYSNVCRGVAEYHRGSFLIITHDAFAEHIQPLADWKHRNGWPTLVVRLSDIGSDPTGNDIRAFVLDAYLNWEIPPEYVLLVGDTHMQGVGEFRTFYKQPPGGGDADVTDHPYSLLEGDDYFSDLLVGRLSVDSAYDLVVTVNKILSYEREPYLTQTAWFKRALVIAGNYSETPPIPTTPRLTSLWLREKMLNYGYTEVDTVFYPPTTGPQLISASINRGVGIVNYRGWGDANGWHYPNFKTDDILILNNGFMLPVMTSIVCNSGDFGNQTVDPCFGEVWLRAGTPMQPKGGVAFFGPSDLYTSTKYNNAIDAGLYWGLFDEQLSRLGAAAARGKLELYLGFPNLAEPDGWVEFYFHVYNILGDPSLDLWTDVPQHLSVSHAAEISLGENTFEVTVMGEGAEPLEGASVCLHKGEEVYVHGYTDAGGGIDFAIMPTTEDTMFVTVTAHNCIPYVGYALVTENRSYIGYYDHDIDDSAGNDNGMVNPGEAILLPLTVKNYGTAHIAIAVTGTLKTSDPLVTITNAVVSFGNVGPGYTSTGTESFEFVVNPSCPDGRTIRFTLGTKDDLDSYSSEFGLDVVGANIAYAGHTIDDGGGNGLLDPGESADVVVMIENDGLLAVADVTGLLKSGNAAVTVIDSNGTFHDLQVGQAVENASDPFTLRVASSATVGRVVTLRLCLSGRDAFSDTTSFSLTIGTVASTDPLGPDTYGYYAYDHTDVAYDEAPFYDWIEVDPDYGGEGIKMILGDDDKIVLDLPFPFRYYGRAYDEVTVSSNGWLAPGESWMNDFRNWGIPAALGPYGMIAVFWDDLDSTLVSGSAHDEIHVCSLYEPDEHRFVVEWSRVLNHYDSSMEILEAVLYDPEYWPTHTGDGEILFQYHTVNNVDATGNFATVGIESPTQGDGLEYTFANRYPPAAAHLISGMAIKFTTDPPDTFATDVELELSQGVPEGFALFQNHPNPFNPETDIRYRIGESGCPVQTTVKVYNILGQVVRTLVDMPRVSGHYIVTWDGCDTSGNPVPSGIYFYSLVAGDVRQTKKMLLLK